MPNILKDQINVGASRKGGAGIFGCCTGSCGERGEGSSNDGGEDGKRLQQLRGGRQLTSKQIERKELKTDKPEYFLVQRKIISLFFDWLKQVYNTIIILPYLKTEITILSSQGYRRTAPPHRATAPQHRRT